MLQLMCFLDDIMIKSFKYSIFNQIKSVTCLSMENSALFIKKKKTESL